MVAAVADTLALAGGAAAKLHPVSNDTSKVI